MVVCSRFREQCKDSGILSRGGVPLHEYKYLEWNQISNEKSRRKAKLASKHGTYVE